MGSTCLDWALETFSGYVAVDELYEGPYCVLSAVDNRQYKRILYEVLDHDPCHDDIDAAIPGERQTPVCTTTSQLPFRKHQCENTPLTGTI